MFVWRKLEDVFLKENQKVITGSFDNLSEEIIKVCKREDAKKIDACILTFSNEILQ